MAEVLLRDRLEQVGVEVHVHSAGLLAGGRPASEHGVAVMRARGLDLTGHRSRRMTAELLRDADLVIAMAREHVREAVVLEPDAFPRTFTLRELVRRARGRPRRPGEHLRDWAARLHDGRTRRDLLGVSSDDDIADPIGGSPQRYAATADELEELIGRVVELGWGEGAG